MSASYDDHWERRLEGRLQLREALVQRHGQWVRERREGLLFLHVSKSGGTSLDNFLSGFFPADDVLPTELQVRRIADWDHADWARYKYFKLEWPIYNSRLLAPQLHYVTMLRDPVQRIVSLYKHLRRPDDHSQQYETVRNRRTPEQETARQMSLRDWVTRRHPQPGAYYRHPYLGTATIGVFNMTSLSDGQLDDLLEQGKANLRDQFAFVGIVEEYLESQRLFCRTFGVPLHYAAHREKLNAAPATDPDPTAAEALDILRHENRWDVALYAYARQLFTQHCQVLANLRDVVTDGETSRGRSAASGPRPEASRERSTNSPVRGCINWSGAAGSRCAGPAHSRQRRSTCSVPGRPTDGFASNSTSRRCRSPSGCRTCRSFSTAGRWKPARSSPRPSARGWSRTSC